MIFHGYIGLPEGNQLILRPYQALSIRQTNIIQWAPQLWVCLENFIHYGHRYQKPHWNWSYGLSTNFTIYESHEIPSVLGKPPFPDGFPYVFLCSTTQTLSHLWKQSCSHFIFTLELKDFLGLLSHYIRLYCKIHDNRETIYSSLI